MLFCYTIQSDKQFHLDEYRNKDWLFQCETYLDNIQPLFGVIIKMWHLSSSCVHNRTWFYSRVYAFHFGKIWTIFFVTAWYSAEILCKLFHKNHVIPYCSYVICIHFIPSSMLLFVCHLNMYMYKACLVRNQTNYINSKFLTTSK